LDDFFGCLVLFVFLVIVGSAIIPSWLAHVPQWFWQLLLVAALAAITLYIKRKLPRLPPKSPPPPQSRPLPPTHPLSPDNRTYNRKLWDEAGLTPPTFQDFRKQITKPSSYTFTTEPNIQTAVNSFNNWDMQNPYSYTPQEYQERYQKLLQLTPQEDFVIPEDTYFKSTFICAPPGRG
jgi:hypothetical protein